MVTSEHVIETSVPTQCEILEISPSTLYDLLVRGDELGLEGPWLHFLVQTMRLESFRQVKKAAQVFLSSFRESFPEKRAIDLADAYMSGRLPGHEVEPLFRAVLEFIADEVPADSSACHLAQIAYDATRIEELWKQSSAVDTRSGQFYNMRSNSIYFALSFAFKVWCNENGVEPFGGALSGLKSDWRAFELWCLRNGGQPYCARPGKSRRDEKDWLAEMSPRIFDDLIELGNRVATNVAEIANAFKLLREAGMRGFISIFETALAGDNEIFPSVLPVVENFLTLCRTEMVAQELGASEVYYRAAERRRSDALKSVTSAKEEHTRTWGRPLPGYREATSFELLEVAEWVGRLGERMDQAKNFSNQVRGFADLRQHKAYQALCNVMERWQKEQCR